MVGPALLTSRWRGAVHGAVRGAAELLLPRACVACGGAMGAAEDGVACGACWSRVPLLPKPWCRRCGHPLHGSSAIGPPPTANGHQPFACRGLCDQLHPQCLLARSVCWVPHAASSPLLAALKYQGWWVIADAMALRMMRTGREVLDGIDAPVFVPVPLAPGRLRERGFNQSELLARGLARRARGEVASDLLVRLRETGTQTQLTPVERLVNVHSAFAVPEPRRVAIRGRSLVLVDDVLTTGATLNACAVALLDGGASQIRYWTFGRARTDADRP